MLIKKKDSVLTVNSDYCKVNEFQFPYEKLGVAKVFINGRYPESGKGLNLECDMSYYVTSGSGVIYYNGEKFEVSCGDVFYFEKNVPYFIFCNSLEIVLSTSPAWRLEQYIIIE